MPSQRRRRDPAQERQFGQVPRTVAPFGSGLFSADKLILDEAYVLSDMELGWLLPTAVAGRNGEVVYAQTEEPQN